MSAPLTPGLPAAVEQLSFRYPQSVPGCACIICTRAGIPTDTNYPSPFAEYKLVRVEGYTEREPTDEERAQFNAQYPALAFSRTSAEAGGKLATPWVKLCQKLIRGLMKLKSAAAFCNPVDPVKLNIPDYLSIVKHPMDFSTIDAKLTATEAAAAAAEVGDAPITASDGTTYRSPDDFASDVRMVFRNAFLYNKPENVVAIWAKEMSIKFEQGWSQL